MFDTRLEGETKLFVKMLLQGAPVRIAADLTEWCSGHNIRRPG